MHQRKFGPLPKDISYPKSCPACDKPFKEGDYTTLIALGPGDDEESQEKCREGLPFNAIALQVHWQCATGEKP